MQKGEKKYIYTQSCTNKGGESANSDCVSVCKFLPNLNHMADFSAPQFSSYHKVIRILYFGKML